MTTNEQITGVLEATPTYPQPLRMSDETDKIFSALLESAAAMDKAVKSTEGQIGTRKYKYADLADVFDASSAGMQTHKLVCIAGFRPWAWPKEATEYVDSRGDHKVSPGIVYGEIAVRVVHVPSGQWVETSLFADCENTTQGIGKLCTYFRRYGRLNLLDIITDDDDGAGSLPRNAPPPRQRGHDPRRTGSRPPQSRPPAPQTAPQTPAPQAKPAETQPHGPNNPEPGAEEKRAELWNQIILRTEGDLEAAHQVLREVTSFEKKDGTMFNGYADFERIWSNRMANMAAAKLREHETFGDDVMGYEDGEPTTQVIEPIDDDASAKPLNTAEDIFPPDSEAAHQTTEQSPQYDDGPEQKPKPTARKTTTRRGGKRASTR